jgi:flavin reductase (DIM6/NTAB) family NADH-FMN oxidoreductase RutF
MSSDRAVQPSDRPADVEGAVFREAMSRWASGVTVVTAAGPDGPAGMTASAFSSLSLDPPLILVCVAHSSTQHDALVGAVGFAVHFLALDQHELSNHFAKSGGDKFAGLEHRPGPFGAPLLDDVHARLVCAREDTPPGGDHTILIGRVVEIDLSDGQPLLHWNRSYRRLADHPAIAT